MCRLVQIWEDWRTFIAVFSIKLYSSYWLHMNLTICTLLSVKPTLSKFDVYLKSKPSAPSWKKTYYLLLQPSVHKSVLAQYLSTQIYTHFSKNFFFQNIPSSIFQLRQLLTPHTIASNQRYAIESKLNRLKCEYKSFMSL